MKHPIIDLVIIMAAIIFIVNIIGPVSNFVTGISVAHTGFTPNQNLTYTSIGSKTNPQAVTASPGITPLLQMLPVAFMAIVMITIFVTAERMLGGSVITKTTGILIPKIEESKPPPPWNCHNCGGPNANNQKVCQYCGKVYPGDFTSGFWKYQ